MQIFGDSEASKAQNVEKERPTRSIGNLGSKCSPGVALHPLFNNDDQKVSLTYFFRENYLFYE
jgi:hypothetical protein